MTRPDDARVAAGDPAEAAESTDSIGAAEPTERSATPMAYGFVGAGEITSAIVEGLSRDVDDPPPVFLSPRGHRVGRELANRFPNVRVCRSNQDVLDNATAVVLAVRTPVVHTVASELTFREQHVVISAVAGARLQELRDWTAPARRVVRSIPLPQAADRQSLTALYPDDAVARQLFTRVGSLLVPDDEPALEAVHGASATFAGHLDYLATITDWMVDQGVDRAAATAYTTHVFGQLGRSLLKHPDSVAALTEKHMTPGGNNEHFMTDLRRGGVPDMVRDALDRVLARVRG